MHDKHAQAAKLLEQWLAEAANVEAAPPPKPPSPATAEPCSRKVSRRGTFALPIDFTADDD